MELALNDTELRSVLEHSIGDTDIGARELLWSWALSRVERVHVGTNRSVIVKRSRSPLDDEGRILLELGGSTIPLPDILHTSVDDDQLTIVMEDLGPSAREPTLIEAASVARLTHATTPPSDLPLLDEDGLRQLPDDSLKWVDVLVSTGRWKDTNELQTSLQYISNEVAPRLAAGAGMPPFGLCHSEFHPTSLHIGTHKTGLVDWARAFVGPGLLDLASFAGTTSAPDRSACRDLIEAYIASGGPETTGEDRAGMPAERWALFWHRIWVVEWFLVSCATWMTDTKHDPLYQSTVERHLQEALDLSA